jgi:hypothetical protein
MDDAQHSQQQHNGREAVIEEMDGQRYPRVLGALKDKGNGGAEEELTLHGG